MKKILVFLFFLTAVSTSACHCLSFKEAQKQSRTTNKFILVHFINDTQIEWDMSVFRSYQSLESRIGVVENFIYVCVTKESNDMLYAKYHIINSPAFLIVDLNGLELFRDSNFKNPEEFIAALQNYSYPDTFLCNSLNSFHKNTCYNAASRLAQNYFDYSITLDKNFRSYAGKAAKFYLTEAQKLLPKNDPMLAEKNQKIALLKLYYWVYQNNYALLDEKLEDFLVSSIYEDNKSTFYFLKYIAAKALKKDDFGQIETQAKQLEGFDYFVKKAALILEEEKLVQSN